MQEPGGRGVVTLPVPVLTIELPRIAIPGIQQVEALRMGEESFGQTVTPRAVEQRRV